MLWPARKRTPPAAQPWIYAVLIVALFAAKALVLWALDRPFLCPCGFARVWHAGISGPENSQHLADWYSPSHLIFGMLFYWLMWKTSRHWPRGWLYVAATVASVGWEVAENLPFMIERFGDTGLGQPYAGDSILNSVGDTVFTLAGFALAMRLPVAATIVLAAALEVAAGLVARDSFLLTLVTFIHPLDAIQRWQAGG